MTAQPLLSVDDLSVVFRQGGAETLAVDRISFAIEKGETLALVGESGSGKSVSALSILRLLPYPAAEHPSGSVRFKGRELLQGDERELLAVRGNDISMIFQEPMTSLNPLHTVARQIGEVLKVHQSMSEEAARARTIELLDKVGIADPEMRLESFPHQLSGGQRQRVMIAMALANEPDLLIADEPTTALDVTIQAQILELLDELRERLGMAIVLITHDLGVVAEVCDRVVVMYAGQVVEEGAVEDIFRRPSHPYTQGLLAAVPRPERNATRLAVIPGTVPPPTAWPQGCRFHDRCPFAWELPREEMPPLFDLGGGHRSRCWLVEHPERRAEGERAGGGFGTVGAGTGAERPGPAERAGEAGR